ncbi:hypothetical protein SAMN02745229_00970 [Butyrivibrio fibrisolvens DSM 3071]|uniref:Uncharacterized protein n=1 Tax=Butyrivibrio fibrisolvens DSM 3071 TaxID=1121131 RepID=A0A1M5WA58_BUTFI|nr:hypothetical protein SAMN02745229_00970 [Butyrivibrio fibrisolvens DSM 3071]
MTINVNVIIYYCVNVITYAKNVKITDMLYINYAKEVIPYGQVTINRRGR